MKIWERYFLMSFLKTLFLFLFLFFGLYVIIDYATHAAAFYKNLGGSVWIDVTKYYTAEFMHRLDVLLPFALLTTTIRTLTLFNTNNELVALMCSGLSMKRLSSPFIAVALICTALIYANEEWFLPQASQILQHMDEHRSSQRHKKAQLSAIKSLPLEDQSILLFQRYDAEKNILCDVCWIRSIDELYRIQELSLSSPPEASVVDHLIRNSQGKLILADSSLKTLLPNLHLASAKTHSSLIAPEVQPLSSLMHHLPEQDLPSNEKEAHRLSVLIHKLWMPWLCLLAVIIPIPFCWRYSRTSPLFLIYSLAIFSLIAFYLLTNASVLLGRRQLLPPLWAISPPFLLASSYAFGRFLRMR